MAAGLELEYAWGNGEFRFDPASRSGFVLAGNIKYPPHLRAAKLFREPPGRQTDGNNADAPVFPKTGLATRKWLQ